MTGLGWFRLATIGLGQFWLGKVDAGSESSYPFLNGVGQFQLISIWTGSDRLQVV